MVQQVKISDHFYLWTPDTGPGRVVVVSCHGGVLDSTFVVAKGTVFKYYSSPTRSAYGTLDKTLYDDQVKETKSCDHSNTAWNTVDDYSLSKFQGKHGGDSESYGDIKSFVRDDGLSVLSIRNRKAWTVKKSDAMTFLSRAVGLIEGKYPGTVREYRCLFCRVEHDPVYYRDMLTGAAFRG